MKICIFGYTLGTRGSGARQYALDLGKWLEKAGNEVVIVTGQWGDRSPVSEELKYYFLVSHEDPAGMMAQVDFAIRAMAYFRKHRKAFDIVHSVSSYPQFANLAAWVRRLTGLTVVHSILAPCRPQRSFERLDGLICVSREIQKKIKLHSMAYIPPFIDGERFQNAWPRPSEGRGKIFIGTMGAPFRRKGIRYLVEAIPLVMKVHPEAHFRLAIDLPGIQFIEETRAEKAYIDKFLSEHLLKDNVEILGPVEVPRFLKSLDIFVYAVQTTLGMVDLPPSLIEGLAAGCGIVTSEIDGIGELVRDRFNGLLVPRGDHDRPQAFAEKIGELIEDRSLLETLRSNGPSSIERFDLDRVGEEVFQFYRQVLERRGGRDR